MFERGSVRREEVLAARLRREAEATRPAFSPVLHERIGNAVRRRNTGRTMATRPDHSRRWAVIWVPAAVAAAGLLAVVLAWRPPRANQSRPDQTTAVNPRGTNARSPVATEFVAADPATTAHILTDLPDQAVAQINRLVNSAMITHQWVYLDHGALFAAQMLLDPLPLDLLVVDEPPVNERGQP